MAEKEVKKMNVAIKAVELKQKQSVMDLETGRDADIELVYSRFVAPEWDGKTGTEEEHEKALLSEAAKLVPGAMAKVNAFITFAASQSYQNAKREALAKGNYLTQELRSKIVVFMRSMEQFADLSAKDCFERWKAGYLAGKPAAKKILSIVQQDTNEFDEL